MAAVHHVLPRGSQKVRHYGLAHPRQGIDRQWLRMLVAAALALVYVLLAAAKPLPVPIRNPRFPPPPALTLTPSPRPRNAPPGWPVSGATVLAAPSTLGKARRNLRAEMQNPPASRFSGAALPSR
jgi:hypothetical protein